MLRRQVAIQNSKPAQTYNKEYFQPLVDFYNELTEFHDMLDNSVYFAQNNDIFDDEYVLLDEIYEKIKNFPKEQHKVFDNRSIKELNQLMSELLPAYLLLNKVRFKAIDNALNNTPQGHKIQNKLTVLIKVEGGNGMSTIGTQTAVELAKNHGKKILYVDWDTEKASEKKFISTTIGDSENIIISLMNQNIISKNPNGYISSKADKEGYTLDLRQRRGEDREKEFKLYLYKSKRKDIKIDVKRVLRLDEDEEIELSSQTQAAITEYNNPGFSYEHKRLYVLNKFEWNDLINFYNSHNIPIEERIKINKIFFKSKLRLSDQLHFMTRLVIDLAAQLENDTENNYDHIFIDQPPINTPSEAFISVFFKNHLLCVPFNNYLVANKIHNLQDKPRRGAEEWYNDTLASLYNTYKPLNGELKLNLNITMLLNERDEINSEERISNPNFTYSTECRQVMENEEYFKKTFAAKSNYKPDNLAAITIPYYWQVKHLRPRRIPFVSLEEGELLNKEFKKAIENLANNILQRPAIAKNGKKKK